ncbi:MAG TPA: LysM domain-containing protein [Myxococcales bacterium]|nr:LysM domain-containing protein [Myxococcales bacterium]
MRTRTIARWRRAALGSVLAVTLAAPAGARAQQQQQEAPAQAQPPPPVPQPAQEPAAQPGEKPAGDQQAQPEAAPRENAPITGQQQQPPPPDGTVQPVPGAPEEYTIQKGDTLWDLSQKFLNNPWYWPKIWSLNPGIENPHWIYPGNKLHIVPGEGGPQAPAQVEEEAGLEATARNAPEEESGASPDVSVSPPSSPDLDVVNRNSREGDAALRSVSASGKLAFIPPPVVNSRGGGLVTPEELRNAGTLEASFEEKELLATYDTAYARFKGEMPVKKGDKLLIFRPEGPIVDPVSHKTLATQTRTVGVGKVVAVDGQQATLQIERSFEEMERGDRVRPWTPEDKRIAPKPNTADVTGRIVQAVDAGLTTYGEANQVFINRGSADGVQEGNTFEVVRHGDGLNAAGVTKAYTAGAGGMRAMSVQTPPENVGLLLVVDAREHLSTALVVRSVRELQSGDVVEMHAAGAGGGSN